MEYIFKQRDFTTDTTPVYFDKEGNAPYKLKIEMLPDSGELLFEEVPVTVGQVIDFSEIKLGKLKFKGEENELEAYTTHFYFRIADSESPYYSNIGTITIIIPRKASAPTVGNSEVELKVETYNFKVEDFTNEFQDEDGDSYNETIIKTLPDVGEILYEGQTIEEDFVFSLTDVGKLEYNLGDNRLISAQGYCEYPKAINTIIAEQVAEGFELRETRPGELVFIKDRVEAVPNNTDIYAFLDLTSMAATDLQDAADILTNFFNDYKSENEFYTGELYILPINNEDWLNFPNIIHRGSSNQVQERPYQKLPPNFDRTSNSTNTNWTRPESILVLSFIDESQAGYHGSTVSLGLQAPTTRYLNDYKRFMEIKDDFEYFKGIFYPIPQVGEAYFNNVRNAAVMHGLAAIEGLPNFTLSNIINFGVSYAQERNFQRYMDANNSQYAGSNPLVANPYSPQANTNVPGTSYVLRGLKEFGWEGVYNKQRPVSEVFSSDTFQEELGEYISGNDMEEEETRIIEGTCHAQPSICFNFQTSDDSDLNLFSEEATFCFNIVYQGQPPVVDDYTIGLETNTHGFSTFEFTNNYYDAEGDFAHMVYFHDVSSKNGPIPYTLSYSIHGEVVQGTEVPVGNVSGLNFQLSPNVIMQEGKFYAYERPPQELVNDMKNLGNNLTRHEEGVLYFETPSGSETYIEPIATRDRISLQFRIREGGSEELLSNIATLYFESVSDYGIIEPEPVNQAPILGDNRVIVQYGKPIVLNREIFTTGTTPPYYDAEGDEPWMLKILTLPQRGLLQFNEVDVVVDQEILFTDIDSGELVYIPEEGVPEYQSEFEFDIADIGSKSYGERG